MQSLAVLIISYNEEAAIGACIDAAKPLGDVFVVDSHSKDKTVAIAEERGAKVLQFSWDGKYPKKKQWALNQVPDGYDWVLMLDADERVSPAMAAEIADLQPPADAAAYEAGISYTFAGRRLRHGHRVVKRCLVKRGAVHFPEVDDLEVSSMWEVEGHYQPELEGTLHYLAGELVHDDPDPLFDYFQRHNRYSDWEAYLLTHKTVKAAVRQTRTRNGKVFDRMPFKPLFFFVYSYLVRQGFKDGRAGLDYALALSFYYWQIGIKTREAQRSRP